LNAKTLEITKDTVGVVIPQNAFPGIEGFRKFNEEIRKHLDADQRKNFSIFLVKPGTQIEAISEADMNKAGWYRKEDLLSK